MAILCSASISVQAQTLIGTYDINYRFNAAGNPPNGGPNDGNPYYNVQPYGPGPYYINAAPGDYRVVVVGYGSVGPSVAFIWSGDATAGTRLFTPQPGNIGDSLDFTHTFGQITLYYWDWYAGDNDPHISTRVDLYRLDANVVPESGSLPLLACGLLPFAGFLHRRLRRR